MPVIICFEGRLAADPKATRTPNTDTPVTEAVVLVNRRVKRGEEWTDAAATRYDVRAWKRRALALGELGRGDSVVVIGHVETASWEDSAGERQWRDWVVADAIGKSLAGGDGA